MSEKFNGTEGEMISLAEAKTHVEIYKGSAKFAANNETKAFFFGKEKLQELLDQKDCMGIRIYYGIEYGEQGKHIPMMILVGADENRDDLVNGKILDKGQPCPHKCPTSTSLDQ